MKSISPDFAEHLAGDVTTLATCWKVTRRDAAVLGFTDHIRDLEIDGVIYRAASGYTRTAIRSTADLAVDNLDVESVFSDDGITEEDLRVGRYDFAEIRMFVVNYEDLSQGILKLRRGWLGEVSIQDDMYVAELRGMAQKLQMTVGEIYTPDCAADLGDVRCGVDLATLEENGSVASVTSDTTFDTSLTQTTGWYDGGELTWTAGANTGQTVAVRNWDTGDSTLSLFLPALFAVEVGDTFTIRPGCDKSFATCKAKFDNAVNFRGFPHVPGNEQILRYPDAQS
ncbi:MAG: DUF2163 domain-containing protein [Alphaproteobacteria bacterium]|nr:DUF2163 domain-containing protein [Alphaproteobacteria bacterium]